MLLSRTPTLFLLLKLSAALKISIQPTVTAGQDVPLNWAREPSDPKSFKFSLNIVSASGLQVPVLLKNVDTDGQNQDSVDLNIVVPVGRYQILAVLSDSSDSDQGPPGRQQPQPDATTDPFDVVLFEFSTSRKASTAPNSATSTPSNIPTITIPTTSDSDGTTTTLETITTTGPQGKTITVTTFATAPRTVSSSAVGTVTVVGSTSSGAAAIAPSSTTSQATSGSTSSSNVPIIVGSIFGAIVAAAVLSLCCLFLFRRYRRHKNDEALFSAERMVRTPSPSESYLVQPEQTLNEKTRIAYYGID